MRLTSTYTRVAMPHGYSCPHCEEVIEDWHREWVDKKHEVALFRKEVAGDCPWCGGPVYFWSDEKPPAPLEPLPGKLVCKRSRRTAEGYCTDQMGRTLDDYIANTKEGQQYEHYQFDP